MERVDSIDKIAKYLKSQVKHYRKKIETGYKMDENLTKWGGFRVGYNHAKLASFENLLDMIYGSDSWEKELN